MNVTALERLRLKYSDTNIKYTPYEHCSRCGGAGEYMAKDKNWHLCFCVYLRPAFRVINQEINDTLNNLSPRHGPLSQSDLIDLAKTDRDENDTLERIER